MRATRCLAALALNLASVLALGLPAEAQDAPLSLPAEPLMVLKAKTVNPSVDAGHPIRIVDEKGTGMTGVAVYVVDFANVDRAQRRAITTAAKKKYTSADNRNLALFALHGQCYATDAEGAVAVPRARRQMVLAVRFRDFTRGMLSLRKGREPRELRLVIKASRAIDVLVVDHRGKPVRGVPVALVNRNEHYHSPIGQIRKTDRSGFVRIERTHIHFYGSGENTVVVQPWFPMVSKCFAKIDPKTFVNDPSKPIKLQLPKYGMVRIYAVDPRGKPVHGIEKMAMQVRGHSLHGRYARAFNADEVTADSALFPFVEVGYDFEAWCTYKGQICTQRLNDKGPRHHLEMRVVTLKGVTAPRSVTFRLLGLDGEPVAREEVGVIFASTGYLDCTSKRTDAKGALRLIVQHKFADADEGVLTLVRRGAVNVRKSRRRKNEPWMHGLAVPLRALGAVRVSQARLLGKPQLGDLQLVEENLLVSGRAVDEQGKPVAGVLVSVDAGYQIGQQRGSSTGGDYRFFAHATRTDAEGRFEFRELSEDRASVDLKIAGNFHVISGDDPDVGAKDHELVVGRTSRIVGSMKGVLEHDRFQGEIIVLDGEGNKLTSKPAPRIVQTGKGHFEIQSCPAGTYQVQFKFRGTDEPFFAVDELVVELGKDCEDPRLQNIDLDKYSKSITVRVLDPEGHPASGITIWKVKLKAGRMRSMSGSGSSNGVAKMRVPAEGVNLAISHGRGRYRRVHFEGLKEDKTVKLEPGIPIVCTVSNLPKLSAGLQFNFQIQAVKRGGKWWDSVHSGSSVTLLDRSEMPMFVDSAGPQRVTIYPVSSWSRRERHQPFFFEVDVKQPAADDKKPQAIEIELDEEQIAEIKDRIEQIEEKLREKKK